MDVQFHSIFDAETVDQDEDEEGDEMYLEEPIPEEDEDAASSSHSPSVTPPISIPPSVAVAS